MKALVTGGGGFIGSNLVRALLARGDDVRVLDNFSTGSRANLAGLESDVELVEGDLRSYERVHAAVRGAEVVFHQGALPSVPRSVQDPLTTTAVNIEGTLNVLLAARDEGVRRVVIASSSSVYGNTGELPRVETQAPDPISPYAVAKLAAERFCTSFSRVYGMEIVSLRYFNVFGPRQDPTSQYAAVVPRFIRAIADGEPVTIYGDGEQSRDFTFVDNVVAANLLAADAAGRRRRDPQRRRPAAPMTVNALADAIGALLGQAGREAVRAGTRGRRARLVGRRRARRGACSASSRRSTSTTACGAPPTTSSERTDDGTRIRIARRARRGLRLPQGPQAARRDGVRRERDRHARRATRASTTTTTPRTSSTSSTRARRASRSRARSAILGPGGLLHVESTTPRKVSNASETEDLVMLVVGGKDGYVERDGHMVDEADIARRAAFGSSRRYGLTRA